MHLTESNTHSWWQLWTKTRNREELSQLNKEHLQNKMNSANIYLMVTLFSPKIRNKAKMFSLTTAIHHCTKSPSKFNKTRRGDKKYTDWEGRNNTVFICRWYNYNYLHRKIPKNWLKQKLKLLELIKYSKILVIMLKYRS